jgi:monoamine oxidase
LSTPVTHVRNWNGNSPVVVTTEHGTLRAKRIVMALSPSQAHVIDFEPPLPAERATLQRRWPAATDMVESAMVMNIGSGATPVSAARVSGSTTARNLWAWDKSPPDGDVGVIGLVHRTTARHHADTGRAKRR